MKAKDITNKDEIFIYAVTINKEEYMNYLKPNGKCSVNFLGNDKIFGEMSEERQEKLQHFQNEIGELFRESVLENFVKKLKDDGYTDEEIGEVYGKGD